MQQGQKQKTSVFSEYQNNQNDSISSRQLEYWLKQTAPIVQPKLANQWTLMSTSSIYEQEEHTLVRNQTFQSIGKENDPVSFNSLKPPLTNNSAVHKSKSYVNAMIDLQTKLKQLEKQNQYLKTNIKTMRDDKNKTMNESAFINQQLKKKIQYLQPKNKKLQQFIHENKKLRDWKEQTIKKLKLMQKLNHQNKAKMSQYQKESQRLKQIEVKLLQDIDNLQTKFQQQNKTVEKSKQTNIKLQQKNKILEDMKQKSTTSIIEKYSKSVDMVQTLTHQNMQLKQQIHRIKNINEQKIKQSQNRYIHQREQAIKNIERLQQENSQKKQFINSISKDVKYFKQKFQKANQELINVLKKHSQQIQKIKQNHSRQKQEWINRQKLLKQKYQEADLNRESIIKSYIKQQATKNIIVQSQLQFDQGNDLILEQQIQQCPKYETRSVGKQKIKPQIKKSQGPKPADTLSYQNNQHPFYVQANLKSANKIKQKLKINSKQKGIERPSQKSKSRKSYDKIHQNSNQHSFILKSCQPITQREKPQLLFYSNKPNNDLQIPDNENIPYYWDTNQIPEFSSQRGNIGNNSYAYNLDKAILIEINREAVRLIEQQQNLLSISNQNCSPNERAENIGRLKQISQQIRVNNDKIIEIKKKIANY